MKEKIRCFIAIDLPETWKKEAIAVQEQLKKLQLFKGKYTEPANIHLTLKFLGELEEEKVEEVKEKLKTIAFNPCSITLTTCGVFSEKVIRIIWMQAEGEELYELQKKIDSTLAPVFQKEERFMGHITIARVKHVDNKEKVMNALNKIQMQERKGVIHNFALRKSTLTAGGPKYEDLAIYSARKEQTI